MVDQMLMQFLGNGLLDKKRWANLMGRASEDDMWQAIREFANEAAEAEKQMAAIQQQEAQQMQQAQQQNVERAFASQDADRQASMAETMIKSQAKQTPM